MFILNKNYETWCKKNNKKWGWFAVVCCAPKARWLGCRLFIRFKWSLHAIVHEATQERGGNNSCFPFNCFSVPPCGCSFWGQHTQTSLPITPLSQATKRYIIINPREGCLCYPKRAQIRGELPICLQVDPGLKSLLYIN